MCALNECNNSDQNHFSDDLSLDLAAKFQCNGPGAELLAQNFAEG
jgi:hypothetical protein